jgi:UDP-N-acetylmuramate dehydrogenase
VDALATPADRFELAQLLALCARHGLPHVVLGGGFNLLVRDGGLDGVAISLARFKRLEERPDWSVRVESGVSHARLTRFCIDHGLSGLEFGCGIPGTIGGWIAMNAGIGVREVKDALLEAEVISPAGGHITHRKREELAFRYRSLGGLAPGSIVLSALFAVRPCEPETLRARVREQLSRRSTTQPLDIPSCGSVFKNPSGDFAGRLIEAAGLKGARVGGAEISTVHANFIVNRGAATAADVLALIARAHEAVRASHGVALETEVRIVGYDA